jgi:hypothetical protein
MTSLDITTIYRRMAAGTFPQPVRVGTVHRDAETESWTYAFRFGSADVWKIGHAKDGRPDSQKSIGMCLRK